MIGLQGVVEAIGETIDDAFAGDAHALLVRIYKDPMFDWHVRQDAAKAALPYEKTRPVTVTGGNEGQPPKVRSELEIGRRLAFVLELIARGEVKAKMPKGAPPLDGLEVPERDLAGRGFATSQIASIRAAPSIRKKQCAQSPDRCEPAR